MPGMFPLIDTARSRVQEANLVQAKFLFGWGGLLCLAIRASALGSAIGQADVTHAFGVFFKVLALGIVIAGASAMIAWLLGLLFGIPRSIANAGVPVGAAPPVPAPASGSPPGAPAAASSGSRGVPRRFFLKNRAS